VDSSELAEQVAHLGACMTRLRTEMDLLLDAGAPLARADERLREAERLYLVLARTWDRPRARAATTQPQTSHRCMSRHLDARTQQPQ
jgi:hypothetical protein